MGSKHTEAKKRKSTVVPSAVQNKQGQVQEIHEDIDAIKKVYYLIREGLRIQR